MATCFLLPSTNNIDRFFSLCGREVIEHDTVGDVGREGFVDLIEVTHLDFYFQRFAFLLTIITSTCKCIRDSSGEVHMVVLEQNHVEQADSMVHASAERDRFLLQIAQSGRRLACIEHMATGVLDEALVLMRRSRYAGHTLHDIEHRTLYLQQTQLLAIDLKCHITGLDERTVLKELLHTAFGVEIVDNLFRHFHAGKHAGIFDD